MYTLSAMQNFARVCGSFLAGGLAVSLFAQAPKAPSYADFAFTRDGRVAQGKEIFGRIGCAACHTVDGSGGKAGPDLVAIGDALPRRELVASVLTPSASIAVGYEATLVTTKAGGAHYGVIKQANAERLELVGVDGVAVRVATNDIAKKETAAASLMPEGLHTTLTLQEFTDLVEFLVSLKQPANALRGNRGMPENIPVLAKPVSLRPFFKEELRFPGIAVAQPGVERTGLTWFGQVPGERGTYLALQQKGTIWRMEQKASGDTKELFGDITSEVFSARGPNGLVALAFHPRFAENRKYYLKHQVLEEGQIATVLIERKASADGRKDSGEASRRLMKIVCVTQNHTGGYITFGPDGFLYLGMGDTGPQQDPNGHGQDFGLLLGKMLRIDVDRRDPGLAYAIPADNPLRGKTGARPEIWAWGFREPWRFSFDPLNGDLWVGDVGQNRVEEVTLVRRGENHGWNVFEAFEPHSNKYRREGEVFVPPVMAYKRQYGNSVTGGYVYRGDPKSSFYGVYVFGDYTSHLIWGLTHENRELKTLKQIAVSPEGIVGFATDEDGRMFVVGYEGMVWEMDFTTSDFAGSVK
jgi:putative heme-binding domain-containing protein